MLIVLGLAVSASFKLFINCQRAIGRLNCIVINKCHIVLELTSSWRSCVLRLQNLVKAETQLVYLTATLKLKEESKFI